MAELAGLIVDYGGVITNPLQDTLAAWCETDGIDLAEARDVIRRWLGESYGDELARNPVHALERGELEVPDFERQLAARLRTRDGRPVEAAGMLTRMFAGFDEQPTIPGVLRRARRAGIRTALLSNSWGNEYPREGWDELFDAVVISGEVGLRKPEPEIYRLAADRLGLAPEQCVFVDDLRGNVRGAVGVGMVGVHHVTPQQTVSELVALFGVPLTAG
jgi:epoxide hydrolase-like predicted phosphatase